MVQQDVIHAISGGSAGCAGALVTSPLEVVKTRLQSSVGSFQNISSNSSKCANLARYSGSGTMVTPLSANLTQTYVARLCTSCSSGAGSAGMTFSGTVAASYTPPRRLGLTSCIRHIVQKEGMRALYKGLFPTLVGVIPTRAIFFTAYEYFKSLVFTSSSFNPPDTLVHMVCSGSAGFVSCSLTNPIWFLKTRLQLAESRLTLRECFLQVWREHGARGFYKGITASYAGISETVIHIAIYEFMKQKLYELRAESSASQFNRPSLLDAIGVPGCAAFMSKSCASFITYPTDVARTRLRQEGGRSPKYRGFFQTLNLVFREEGFHALFRGVTIQIMQKVPNTMVTMITYEMVSKILSDFQGNNDEENHG